VKHGDIDSSITDPKASYDVHMGSDGNNFTCQECHATNSHAIKGNAMVVSPGGTNHVACTDCHDAKPHKNGIINKHVDSVACQTCHIPFFAKDVPTKMEWDWSTAGQDGRDDEKDQYGMHAYAKMKGSFVWAKNVVPVYAWYNGSAGAYMRGDKIDAAQVTKLNWPNGDIKDQKSKIYPFKVHKGKQVYDVENKYFLMPKVWASGPDADAAYWKSFNWDAALKAGSNATGLAYSGKYDFAPTEMYWRINHMVAPKNEALKCNACHGDNSRLDWKALGYEGDPRKTKKSRGKM
jgi:octaheme c-type cytochrome (tetrathionate reductase family)